MSRVDRLLDQARQAARLADRVHGVRSPISAAAWDVVSELLDVRSSTKKDPEFNWENHCSENPDSPECKIYE